MCLSTGFSSSSELSESYVKDLFAYLSGHGFALQSVSYCKSISLSCLVVSLFALLRLPAGSLCQLLLPLSCQINQCVRNLMFSSCSVSRSSCLSCVTFTFLRS